jgi:hypothetical protein
MASGLGVPLEHPVKSHRPILLLLVIQAAGKNFRGGHKKHRDQWFGLDKYPCFECFRPWWHREGKTGEDLQNAKEARAAYQEWVDLGRPKVK